MGKTHTWQHVENGCRACNATGAIQIRCRTWNDPNHNRNTCPCVAGFTQERCRTCRGLGKTR